MQPIIECVPNFSEGRNLQTIKTITDAIETVEGIRLLDVDPGKATNRTVVTFVGSPDDVIEAAFRGIAKAPKSLTCATTQANIPVWAPPMYVHLSPFRASAWRKPQPMPKNWPSGWQRNYPSPHTSMKVLNPMLHETT